MDKQTKGISQVNFPWNHGYSPQNPIVSLDRSDLPDEFDSGVIEYQLLEKTLRGNTFMEVDHSRGTQYSYTLVMPKGGAHELKFSYRDITVILSTADDREVDFIGFDMPLAWTCASDQYLHPGINDDLLEALLHMRGSLVSVKKRIDATRSSSRSERQHVKEGISSLLNPIINKLISFGEDFYNSDIVSSKSTRK